jgi:hypothetical protein
VRPKIAMWSDYGSPTKKRWRSRRRRSARSSIGLRILLVAVASVAGVVGISGVYPQIIDLPTCRSSNRSFGDRLSARIGDFNPLAA